MGLMRDVLEITVRSLDSSMMTVVVDGIEVSSLSCGEHCFCMLKCLFTVFATVPNPLESLTAQSCLVGTWTLILRPISCKQAVIELITRNQLMVTKIHLQDYCKNI